MQENKLSSWSIAAGAWRDAFQAIGAMRAVTVTAFLALTLVNLLPHLQGHSVLPKPNADPLHQSAVSSFILLGVTVLEALLLTPLAIAVHRFILLDERTSSYRFDLGLKRFRRFAFYTFVVQILSLTPTIMMLAFAITMKRLPPAALPFLMLGFSLIAIAGGVVALMLVVRITLLFPAVAIDVPRAGWNRALDESQGHAWRIFFVLVLTSLIAIAIALGIGVVEGGGAYLSHHGQTAPGAVLISIARAATKVLVTAALVAAASRLYRVFIALPADAEPAE